MSLTPPFQTAGAASWDSPFANPAPTGAGRGDELSLFVFIDALGWRIFEHYRDILLADELRVAAPMESVLGYSCACDPTILTGRMPADHGHFSFFRYAPDASPFRSLRPLRWLPRLLTDSARFRRLLSRRVADQLGYTGYFQLYNVPFEALPLLDYTEKRDLYQPGGINFGVPTIFDELRARSVPFVVSDWRKSESENLAAMSSAIQTGAPRFAYLYLAGLDGLLHAHGPESPEGARQVRWYDAELRRLLAIARKRYSRVRLHLLSDHGMAAVERGVDLIEATRRSGLRFGRDYVAVFDSTMVRFWRLNDRGEQGVDDLLDTWSEHGHALSRAELQSFGCWFPDGRYGERIFVLRPGVVVSPSHMGRRAPRGMHGYDPAAPDSMALIASTAPVCVPPRRLDEVHGLMCREAGIEAGVRSELEGSLR